MADHPPANYRGQQMKASVLLRDDAPPLFRAKLPVTLFAVPAVASLTAGDPCDLCLSLATAAPALPSLRLSYSPTRASSVLSLSLLLGSGPGGSPAGAVTMAAEMTASGAISFSLLLRPSLGDFAVRRRYESAGSGSLFAAPSEVTMRSILPVRGGTAAVRVRWGVRIPAEVATGGDGAAAGVSLRRLPYLVLGKVTVERKSERKDTAAPAKGPGEEERMVEKVRRENEKLRREVDELREATTMAETSGKEPTTVVAGGRRRWVMGGDR